MPVDHLPRRRIQRLGTQRPGPVLAVPLAVGLARAGRREPPRVQPPTWPQFPLPRPRAAPALTAAPGLPARRRMRRRGTAWRAASAGARTPPAPAAEARPCPTPSRRRSPAAHPVRTPSRPGWARAPAAAACVHPAPAAGSGTRPCISRATGVRGGGRTDVSARLSCVRRGTAGPAVRVPHSSSDASGWTSNPQSEG